MSVTMDITELYQRGFELRCEGRYAEAEVLFRQVLAVDPLHPDSTWQIGLIQGFLGDFDGSIATLQTVVAQHPTHVDARYDYAMTMMMLGMIDEACAEFKEVLRQSPNHEKALQQAAYCP